MHVYLGLRRALDAYTKLDLSAALPLRGLWSDLAPVALTLRADNVMGTHYQSVAGFDTPGRMLLAGLRAAF